MSSASKARRAVHGSCPRMLSAISCFNFGRRAAVFLIRAILSALALVASVTKAYCPRNRSILVLPSFMPPTICLRKDEQAGYVTLRFGTAGGGRQRFEASRLPGERIVLLGIDEKERKRGLVQEELMDEAVIFLSGQVPQQRLALNRGIGGERNSSRHTFMPCVRSRMSIYLRLSDAPTKSCRPFLRRATDLGVDVTTRRLRHWSGGALRRADKQ